MKVALLQRTLAIATTALILSGCGGGGGGSSGGSVPSVPVGPTSGPPGNGHPQIQHVIIAIQENRSVDNLFQGFPGADTQSYGFDQSGRKIALMPVPLEAPFDFQHDEKSFLNACDGTGSYPGTNCKMDGFDKETWTCGQPSRPPCPNANPPYSYVPADETKPYFSIGRNYIFADRMFPSNIDASSFVSHQYIIAAQADSTVNYPSGPWGCEGKSSIATLTRSRAIGQNVATCFDYETLGDELDKAGVSWRFYTSGVDQKGSGVWSAYQAVKHIFDGADWNRNVVTPQTKFFSDVTNGNLPAVSWITPTCRNSDHPYCGSKTGPDWIASLVNAIGASQYWDSTVIFVFWDDYGGWYDHVPPQSVDYDGLGIRVPLLMVSAYAKKGCVSHVRFEHGSILKFIEDQWGLPRLSASDARANPVDSACFDFAHAPRHFVSVPSTLKERDFIRQPVDPRPPDTE